MGSIFNRIWAGVALACALLATASLTYYYEALAFADSPWGAIAYTGILVFSCSAFCFFLGEEN